MMKHFLKKCRSVTLLLLALLISSQSMYAQISAVPTYNSIGLYWSGVGGSDITCNAEYRKSGAGTWLPAHELWWDDRPSGEYHGQEYRGSIVGLNPGTSYEIRLTLSNGTSETVSINTWTDVEDLPVSSIQSIDSQESGYEITSSGSSSGYVVFDGGNNMISGGDEVGLTIDADYVIIKNLIITDVGEHGIEIEEGRHHVIIDNVDISEWGTSCNGTDGTFQNEMDNAVFAGGCVNNITIQNSKLHHPRYSSNHWDELECNGASTHPKGARGVGFYCSSTGELYQLVIRNNEIYSDYDRMFNDGMGNNYNFSYVGFPGMDSDIYGNYVSHCWDDGIEAEGANGNVRIYENEINHVNIGMAFATTSVGPLYAFRNIVREQYVTPQYEYGWNMFKLGAEAGYQGDAYSKGKIYLYHNQSSGYSSTCIAPSTDNKRQWNVTSRNNILHSSNEWSDQVSKGASNDAIAYHAASSLPDSDLDYDLCTGDIPDGFEPNAVVGFPIYESGSDKLAPNSPGFDAGITIPNFNDQFSAWPYHDTAPDMGAYEGEPIGCDGVLASGAYVDNCGNCVGGTTGLEACVKPNQVKGTFATGTESGVELYWSANSDEEEDYFAGYNVWRGTISGGSYTLQNSTLLTITSYVDNNTTDGTEYFYVIRAVGVSGNESFESDNSEEVSAIAAAPAAPSGVSASGNDGLVTINWESSPQSFTSGYHVYRSQVSNTGYTKLTESVITDSYFDDYQVLNDVEYFYVITAISESGIESYYSSEVNTSPYQGDATILSTETAPQIDGQVDDAWGLAPAYTIDNVTLGSISGDDDLLGEFKLLVDPLNLYILIDITDDARSVDSGEDSWEDDGLEIYIDGDNSKSTGYGNNDFQYILTRDNEIYDYKHGGNTAHIIHAITENNSGYTAEISIPLSELDIDLKNGQLVGFDIHLTDDDNGGGREGKLAWYGTNDNSAYDPSLFGSATLKLENIDFNFYTITATAGEGGSISPNGTLSALEGSDVCFDIEIDPGYEIAQLLIDEDTVASTASYCFENIFADHIISVSFSAIDTDCGTLAYPSGCPLIIPGMIEAEDFDTGGEGVSYHDEEASNLGGDCRSSGVDVQNSSDGGCNLSYIRSGEWINYTVEAEAGSYILETSIASESAGGEFVFLNESGSPISDTVRFEATGGWQVWETVSGEISLNTGIQTITLQLLSSGFNISSFNFIKNIESYGLTVSNGTGSGMYEEGDTVYVVANTPNEFTEFLNWSGDNVYVADTLNASTYIVMPALDIAIAATYNCSTLSYTGCGLIVPGTIEAEDFDTGAAGISYYDEEETNLGGDCRSSGVDVQESTEGGCNLSYIRTGEWVNYTIDASDAGIYTLETRVASESAGGNFAFTNANGEAISDTISFEATGGWQEWETVAGTIELSEGLQTITLHMLSSSFNINSFSFTKDDVVVIETYSLTVVNGSGDGMYEEGETVAIEANGLVNHEFLRWTGDAEWLADSLSASTTLTVPSFDVTITALYAEAQDTVTDICNTFAYANGCPAIIPGLIEAENFDTGGAGISYYDLEEDNLFPGDDECRDAGPDTGEATENGCTLGYIREGEWVNYTVNVGIDGIYELELRIASESAGGNIEIVSDKGASSGVISFDATGDWSNWETVTGSMILEHGVQTFTVYMLSSSFNLNYFDLTYEGELPSHSLTVNNGIGSGIYNATDTVFIYSDNVPEGYRFDGWIGDIATVADTKADSTYLIMPFEDSEVTANILLDEGIIVSETSTVPTFESMSIYADYYNSKGGAYCYLYYRASEQTNWTQGHDLHVDSANNQFRGSLVYLDPNTTYEIKLVYGDKSFEKELELSETTWSEAFPIGKETVITSTNSTLVITESGTPNGYHLITGPSDVLGVVDVQRQLDNAIIVDANYVIIRNLEVVGATENAIIISEDAHDVVVENCKIHNWGPEGVGLEADQQYPYFNWTMASAIISGDEGTDVGSERLIIQNNKIGPPAGTSSGWDINRHPAGPQGISICQSKGGNVIRYNEILGDTAHYYNDGIGGYSNGGSGNLHKDSDVYGNIISYCKDDAFEIEGYNINVRMWNNFGDRSWRVFATAQVNDQLRGPCYIFRNIMGPSNYNDEDGASGALCKLQGREGPIIFYHNMFGLPDAHAFTGILPTVKNDELAHIITRNNIFFIPNIKNGGPFSDVFRWYETAADHDVDYDHFIFDIHDAESFDEIHQIHKIIEAPSLELDGDFNYFHSLNSSGLDTALLIPGFNHEYDGNGPDTGPTERGRYEFKAGIQLVPFGIALNRTTSNKVTSSAAELKDTFKIYPIPASEKLYIRGNGIFDVNIFSLSGHLVKSYQSVYNELQVDVSKIGSKGMYFVKIEGNEASVMKRIIIE